MATPLCDNAVMYEGFQEVIGSPMTPTDASFSTSDRCCFPGLTIVTTDGRTHAIKSGNCSGCTYGHVEIVYAIPTCIFQTRLCYVMYAIPTYIFCAMLFLPVFIGRTLTVLGPLTAYCMLFLPAYAIPTCISWTSFNNIAYAYCMLCYSYLHFEFSTLYYQNLGLISLIGYDGLTEGFMGI